MYKIRLLLVLFFLFLINSFFIFAVDAAYELGKTSSREDDQALIPYLFSGDNQDALNLIQGISEREDYYFGNYISALLTTQSRKENFFYEFLLRFLINSINKSSLSADEVYKRIVENRASIVQLTKNLYRFQDFYLKGDIISLVTTIDFPEKAALIITEFNKTINILLLKSGPDTGINYEIEKILTYIETKKQKEYVDLLFTVIQHIKSKELVQKARQILKDML